MTNFENKLVIIRFLVGIAKSISLAHQVFMRIAKVISLGNQVFMRIAKGISLGNQVFMRIAKVYLSETKFL